MVSDFKRRGYLTLTCVIAALVRNGCSYARFASSRCSVSASSGRYRKSFSAEQWQRLHDRNRIPSWICGLEADERVANRADSSRDPHAAYVRDLEREQVRRAVGGFLWSSARSFYCANTKSFPMRRLQRCCKVLLVRTCRDWRGRAPSFETCLRLQPWQRLRAADNAKGAR